MINTDQSSTGVVDSADVLVKIEKDSPLAPQIKKYLNVCVLATKSGAGQDLNGRLVTDKKDIEADIEEADELNFIGSIRVWNTALTDDVVKAMAGYAETVVVLSERVDDAKDYDFKDMVVWLTEAKAQTSLDDFVIQPNHGVMLDPGKQGKLLFAVTTLLYNRITYTNKILGNFTGINDQEIASELDNQGYSYFFKANDRTWLRGFWLGGKQARTEYADRSVRYDVKQSVSAVVASGLNFTNENLALIEARILQSLKQNEFVDQILSVSVPRSQKPTDKVKGMVFGVKVEYETVNEIRSVYINLGGAV